jgi:peptide/nickel transport system permease protein
LDKPYYAQYLDWIAALARGELGKSFWKDTPISEILARRAPITFQVALMAVILSWLIGLPVGVLSAVKYHSGFDVGSRIVVTLFMAVPSFWLGLMFILLLVSLFSWRPPLDIVYLSEDPAANLQMTLGPSLTLGIGMGAVMARITRSSVLEVLHEEYVRTARAKGLRERAIVWGHVLKNAMLPILTFSGVIMGQLLAGSVAVERAFSVPGLGLALVSAIYERDWMVIQNLVLLYGGIYILINLVVDISYALVDPRIRYR